MGIGFSIASETGDKKNNFYAWLSCICFIIGITGPVVSISIMCYDSYSGSETNNIGIGTVVRLDNSVGNSVTTHTVVKLNGINYTCYGYVPDAKEVAVIETKRRLTGVCSYTCELPD